MSVTHIAGRPVALRGHLNRVIQRCALCGAMMDDRSIGLMIVKAGHAGLTPYPEGHLIRFKTEEGPTVRSDLGPINQRNELPADFCLRDVDKQ